MPAGATERPNARIVDVAEAAGFSPSVVSRVLSGRGDVSSETRMKILAAAHELGYERYKDRRGRPRVQPQLIDLTLAYFNTGWAAEVIAGAWNAAAPLGFDLLLTTERDDVDDDWVRRTQARGAAGAIIGLIRPTAEELTTFARSRTPVVLLDPRSDSQNAITSVGTSDHQGGFDAGEHLAKTGATRFVGLVGTPAYRFGRARMQGFVEAINLYRPDASVEVVPISWSPAHAAKAVLPLLKSSNDPIGIFGCNDAMAWGVYEAAARAGRSIPGDVNVVGFDDEPKSQLMTPPLTTIQFPLREAAAAAVNLIADAIKGIPMPTERLEIPSRLIVRGSTRTS